METIQEHKSGSPRLSIRGLWRSLSTWYACPSILRPIELILNRFFHPAILSLQGDAHLHWQAKGHPHSSFLKSLSRDSISEYQVLSNNPQKDNFHNPIFCYVIDNMVNFRIINSTVLTNLSLSKRGGGWGKTFKVFLSKF